MLDGGAEGVRQAWRASEVYTEDEEWIERLVRLAHDVQTFCGDAGDYRNHSVLAAEVSREQRRLADLEADARDVRVRITRFPVAGC